MEKEKFITIIKSNQRLIYKVCFTYCRDTESRKDLEQEILVQLWKSLPRYDGRVKLSTWIYKIAINTAFLFYRNEEKHLKHKTILDETVFQIADGSQSLEQEEKIAELYRFIDNLDKLDKALMMLYLDNNKHKDIADILGITQTNVATKIGRIKGRLKEYFNNKN